MRVLTSQIDRINGNSRLPKYRQVINTILTDIDRGIFKTGERIPSINETSEEFYLSRDTVEKAYRELSRRGIISSVPGKGFYVNSTADVGRMKIMVIFNKLSDYKKVVYNSFVKSLGEIAQTTFFVHNNNFKFFEHLVLDQLGEYDHYVIMPHFYEHTSQAREIISKIPRNKLMILDRDLEGLSGQYGLIYQDFENDIVDGLYEGIDLLRKYESLKLIFPEAERFPREIIKGFIRFCRDHAFPHEVIYENDPHTLCKGSAYITLAENTLIDLIKDARESNLRIGEDIGILSYDDTPIKEILEGGISVLTTDHVKMGKVAAQMILDKSRDRIRNPFSLIQRNSL